MNEDQVQPLRDLRRNLLKLSTLIEGRKDITAASPDDGSTPPVASDVLASLSDRQIAQAASNLAIVDDFGQYDQTSGPDGSCYWDGSDNQWQSDGIMCQNCIFFQDPDGDPSSGDEGCILVAGSIDGEGLCKLWVIPGEELESGATSAPDSDAQ